MPRLASLLAACLLSWFGASPTTAQPATLTGQVVNAETSQPIARADVFLDGTMRGDATDEKGRFRIENVPPGSYTIVISRVGFSIRRGWIVVSEGTDRRFRIKLQPNPIEMAGVTVEENRSTWLRRLDRFRQYFFGEASISENCEILNPEVLSFDVVRDTLKAYAAELFRVENRALGYEVEYHLRKFEATRNRVHQDVFARFQAMEPSGPKQRRAWEQARRKAYRGSFQHFVRALAKGSFEDEGFRVYTSPTQNYYYGSEPQNRFEAVEPVHEASAIAQLASRPTLLEFRFSEEFLRVEYLPEQEPWAYQRKNLSPEVRQAGSKQLSWISLPHGDALVDLRSGRSFRSRAPLLHGYWAWAERESSALPRDYEPEE